MRKTLVVVDVQKDFYHPNGALYVKGAEVLPERIANIMPLFDDVVFTLDSHPYNHCSFSENGGQWPIHCVAHTEGASLPLNFMQFGKYTCIYKGQEANKEEYGANPFQIKDASWNPFESIEFPNEYVFCGIAGDYCVKETIANFIKEFPTEKVSVYMDGVASIDDGTTLRNFMKENNIQEWNK
jgi:nicotinamidase/pyrazinamidase